MSQVGQREILTQKHVVRFFKTKLGYDYLGHWQDRVGNSNVEQDLLRDWLRRRGHSEKIIGRVLHELDKARTVSGSKTLLQQWYRRLLREQIPNLRAKWEPVIGVQVASCGIKRMKTKWGACNIEERRIWLNLELAKKPPACLEYILVHEMVHLLERHHNDRFRAYMDDFLPPWRLHREELNRAPLAHEDWEY